MLTVHMTIFTASALVHFEKNYALGLFQIIYLQMICVHCYVFVVNVHFFFLNAGLDIKVKCKFPIKGES